MLIFQSNLNCEVLFIHVDNINFQQSHQNDV